MSDTPETSPPTPQQNHIRWLREQIAEIQKSWPAHSVPPGMLQRLEDLEEELEDALRETGSQEK